MVKFLINRFNRFVVLAAAFSLSLSACTTLTPIEMTPDELHDTLRSDGEVVKTGGRVRVVLDDGSIYKFRVVDMDSTRLYGERVEVEIERIIAFESREFSLGKTALLSGVISVIAIAIGIILAAPAIVYAGG